MLDLGEAMFNILLSTGPIEDMLKGVAITGAIRELYAIIRHHLIDGARLSLNQILQELRGYYLAALVCSSVNANFE